MEVTYTLTFEDWLHTAYAYAERKKEHPSRFMVGGIVLAVYGILAAYVTLQDNPPGAPPVIQLLLDLFVIYLGVYLTWNNTSLRVKRKVRAQMAQFPYLFTEHTFKLAPNVLHVTGDFIAMQLKWQAVEEVFSDSKYLFIAVGGSPYTLARRAFATPDDAERFLTTAQAYWNAAKNGTPLPAATDDDGKT